MFNYNSLEADRCFGNFKDTNNPYFIDKYKGGLCIIISTDSSYGNVFK